MSKILIVEDDQIVANIYRNKFALEGFEAEIALDGQAGLSMVYTFQPDAVILDLVLPKLSGVDLIKQVRAYPTFKDMPIIVFSNTYLTNMIQDAWKAGATKCLSKSNCTPLSLIDMVRSLLKFEAPEGGMHGGADAAFQEGVRKDFIDSLPGALAELRTLLKGMIRPSSDSARLNQIQELYRRIHSVTATAGLAGIDAIAQLGDGLEALLKELHEKPKNINPSTLRTVANAIDFLGILFDQAELPQAREATASRILVVDDEAISRRAILHALEKARLKATPIEDPKRALSLLEQQLFDLIFLDVDMPGMNGFELCAKIRTLPAHKQTPVVFVTNLNDFESRANSTMSGGNDLIAKPFLFIELTVKALVYVLRARLARSAKPEQSTSPEAGQPGSDAVTAQATV